VKYTDKKGQNVKTCKLLFKSTVQCTSSFLTILYTGKKENKIFLIYKEIQKGAVAKSYMTIYLHFSSYIRKPFLIYDFATAPSRISLYMRKIMISFLPVYNIVRKEDVHCKCAVYFWIIIIHVFVATQVRSRMATKYGRSNGSFH
jgi:hypothetical protein